MNLGMEARSGATLRGALIRSAQVLWMTAVTAGVAVGQVVPFESVSTLSTNVVPIERQFDIAQAAGGQYRITLTDVGAGLTLPDAAPLDSLNLLITRGKTVVATLDGMVNPDGTVNEEPVDTATFNATPGTYTVHVVGQPGSKPGSGAINLRIESVATGNAVLTAREIFSAPQVDPEGIVSYQTEIEVAAGDYDLTLADLAFPRPLKQADVFLFQDGDSSVPVCLSIVPAAQVTCPATQTVTLAAGKYQVIAGGVLADGSDAGVFSVHFRATASGAVVHSRTVEIGHVKRISPESFQLDAGAHTLNLKDLEFPIALSANSAIVTGAAQVVALANATTPDKAFTVPGNDTPYDVFAYSEPDVTAQAGTYQIEVRPGTGAALLSSIETIGPSSGSTVAYTFPVDVTTAGNYRARLGDFQFPVALSAARLAVVQNGVVVAKTADGDPGPTFTLDVPNLAAGRATTLVIVRPATVGGTVQQSGGTFGLELTSNPGNQVVFDATQGVGGLISVRKVSITQPGRYDLTIADLDFPEAFRDLMAVVSRGAQKLGTVLVGSGTSSPQGGSATLMDFEATTGNYSVTVIARPGEEKHAATYAITFAQAPAGPTITLTADPTTVTTGSTSKLTWNTQDATSCIASSDPAGVWSGSKPTSSTAGENTAALTAAATTFTLKCTGAGGRTSEKSVTVNTAAQSTGSGGGGGSFGWFGLLGLAACRALALARARGAGSVRPAH